MRGEPGEISSPVICGWGKASPGTVRGGTGNGLTAAKPLRGTPACKAEVGQVRGSRMLRWGSEPRSGQSREPRRGTPHSDLRPPTHAHGADGWGS